MKDQFLVDKLFRVSVQREFIVRGKPVTLYVRTLGSASNTAREEFALGRVRALLARIRKEGTHENETFMQMPHQEHRDELIARCLVMNMGRLTAEAAREIVPADTPEPPDYPTLTEIAESLDAEDAALAEMHASVNATAKSRLDEFREQLEAMDDISLIEEAIRLMIDGALAQEFNRASDVATLYGSVFTDEKMRQRYFQSTEEAEEIDPEFATALLATYRELDVFVFQPEQLKN